ncbi:MAG: NTP transferase domain-containing protein [Anaerolineaceae bacterium]|nr:NTP transferase domain-containing protein [Anaerolineaceae bacterium]
MKTNNNQKCEQLSKQEADVLLSLAEEPFINQRILAEKTGYSLGMMNRSLKQLVANGYLNEQIHLTDKGHELLTENAPRNAIILAAGFGMRMAPINFTTPKALLEVNDERLIDRLISQLHEAGVKDVTVIVGFMKDSFEYLIDDYGVDLIYNPAYTTKNNISSLALAADKIHNTYILPCDIWCARNPFRVRELYSWYMVSDLVDEGSEVRVNRKMELVKVPANGSGNGMIGITYLTKDDGNVIRNRIKKFSKDSTYDSKFWEEALFTDDRMIVQARVVHMENVVEINTYEQLREFDSDSRNLNSAAMHIISEKLSCSENDISGIEVLKKGMTNRTFYFEIHKGKKVEKYLMRIPGEGTDKLIDRRAESKVYDTIRGRGFCDDLIYIDPENGYKIAKYIEDVRCCDPENENDLRVCMNKLRSFHNYKYHGEPLKVPHTFDLYERIDFYESLWEGTPSIYRDYQKTKENLISLQPFIAAHREPFQLTHIDAVPDNFLFDPHTEGDLSIQLTDWEYAGMQDKHVDIAMFAIYSLYDKRQIDHLIDLYFDEDGGCDMVTRAKIYCYVAVCGLIWSNWCEYKRNLGVEFGEYSLRQYRYAKDYYKYAQKLMEEINKESSLES